MILCVLIANKFLIEKQLKSTHHVFQKKKNNIKQIEKKIIKFNINELKWHGFKKTSKIILMGYENYKLNINELIDKLSIIYVKKFNEIPENFDIIKAKKILIEKLENNRYFVIDLGKNTIKYKP